MISYLQSNQEAQTGGRSNATDESILLDNASSLTQVSGPQMDMHTLEKNIANKVRSEVDSVYCNDNG